MSEITVVAKLSEDVIGARLVVSLSDTFSSPTYSSTVDSVAKIAKFVVGGLAADTDYFYAVEINSVINIGLTGKLRTKPTASFKFAFGTCNSSGSNHASFAKIKEQDPDFFLHLGDLHYQDISTANSVLFQNAYDQALNAGPGSIFREVNSHYMFDDHDYGPNDSYGGSTPRNTALAAYRNRVPHPPLVQTSADTPLYHSFEVGRCVFIMTDLRSESDIRTKTDDSSKTMMGATQKTWFKNLLSDPSNDGKFFFWCCTRVWHANTITSHDSWGGFTTERTELADHIKTYASGRILVLTGDRHQLGIDDGTNCDYATGGSGPTPIFMAAPLDRSSNTHGSATFSSGVSSGNGQFGIVEVTDSGGDDITINLTGMNSSGTTLKTLEIIADLT